MFRIQHSDEIIIRNVWNSYTKRLIFVYETTGIRNISGIHLKHTYFVTPITYRYTETLVTLHTMYILCINTGRSKVIE